MSDLHELFKSAIGQLPQAPSFPASPIERARLSQRHAQAAIAVRRGLPLPEQSQAQGEATQPTDAEVGAVLAGIERTVIVDVRAGSPLADEPFDATRALYWRASKR